MKLVGPFCQILTMDDLPLKGPVSDDQLQIINKGGILYDDGRIIDIGDFKKLSKKVKASDIQTIEEDMVCMPGMIDVHTHIAWAGSRANDYAMRLSGKTYQEIAKAGGGIWSTVLETRKANIDELVQKIIERSEKQLKQGITTIEVKSGYGLSIEEELKILNAILLANSKSKASLIPTCLAAHIKPRDFAGDETDWLELVVEEIFPELKHLDVSRVDIFVEEGAFSIENAWNYLEKAQQQGFSIALHGDQFSSGKVELCRKFRIRSIDHLESINDDEIKVLSNCNTFSVVLPGASIGLGIPFAPARKLLDKGCSLVLASDWNPGSAPMGDLLIQASLIGIAEKLTMAEVLSAITFRAAMALEVTDRGVLKADMMADFIAFPTNNYKEILYNQGSMKPVKVWKKGKLIK